MKKNILIFIVLTVAFADSLAQTISLVKDINISSLRNGNPVRMAVYRDTLYFTAQPGDNGSSKLYKSDGTAAGTTQIGPSAGIDIVREFFFFKNAFYFLWNDGIHGQELWVSDGSPAGTHLFLDLVPGAGSSEIAYLTICNNKLFFRATDNADFNRLYVSDGTVAGTTKLNVAAGVFNGMNEFIVFKDKVYFPGSSAGIVHGLFVSDGTLAGTSLVKEGVFGTQGGNFAVLHDKMYFSAADDLHGSELWQSDGTSANTQLFFNIATNDKVGVQSNGGPHNLFVHDGTLYFAASDGVHGNELWATDGTSAGTGQVADLIPGEPGISPQQFVLYNKEVYFFGTSGGTKVLYKTNGTLAGTKEIKFFAGVSDFYSICEYQSLLYMSLGSGFTSTVWVSDGTESGTKEITPVISTLPTQEMDIVPYKDELYLPAYASATGIELYKLKNLPNGLDESDEWSGLQLFPNPGNGSFRLSGFTDISEIEAFDAQGSNVGVGLHDGVYYIKSSLKGIYVLRVTSAGNRVAVLKLEIK